MANLIENCSLFSAIKLLKLFPKLFSGNHVKSPLVDYKQVNQFSIIIENKDRLTIDGELIGETPLHVTVLPKNINVLVWTYSQWWKVETW